MCDGECQPAHQAVGAARYSTSHWPVSRLFYTRAGCAASSGILGQFWQRSSARLTNSSTHAWHADGGKKTTVRPSVHVISPCRKARSTEPKRTCTAMTATPRNHQSLRLLREYHLLTHRSISSMRKPNGRSMPRHESVTTSPRRRPQVKRRWILSWVHRNSAGSTRRTNPALVTDGRLVHTFTTRTRYMPQPHWQLPAVLWQRAPSMAFQSHT